MKKVLTIIGTRPEAIKMAPVIRELKRRSDDVRSVVCVTGQHTSLLAGILENFDISSDYTLVLDDASQTLPKIFANLFTNLNDVIQKEKPDWLIAQGDTTSVVAGSMAAYYNKIKFGHIEAGLRTYDLYSPYPEEGNRLMADVCAEKLWAPTSVAKENLLNEGYAESRINITGNTVIDALLYTAARVQTPAALKKFEGRKIILVTVHRRESFGDTLLDICDALKEISKKHPDFTIVYPVHPNPNVHDIVHAQLSGINNIELISPLGYVDFIWIMKTSFLILTDSGGIQEEAPSLGIPVLILREKTERPEGVKAGVAILVGRKKEEIVSYVSNLIANESVYKDMSSGVNPYGDGKAAHKIVEDIINAK